jgi:hypothetical protein
MYGGIDTSKFEKKKKASPKLLMSSTDDTKFSKTEMTIIQAIDMLMQAKHPGYSFVRDYDNQTYEVTVRWRDLKGKIAKIEGIFVNKLNTDMWIRCTEKLCSETQVEFMYSTRKKCP